MNKALPSQAVDPLEVGQQPPSSSTVFNSYWLYFLKHLFEYHFLLFIEPLNLARIPSVVHACHCRDVNCVFPDCLNAKIDVSHLSSCQQHRKSPECPICKELVALCVHHSKSCAEAKCLVPYCLSQREKRLQHVLQVLLYLLITVFF